MNTIEVGQKVMVTDGYGRDQRAHEGTVTKVARVWVTVQYGQFNREIKFRLESQATDSQYPSGSRFYTVEQWAKREAEAAAFVYLREQGISVDHYSPWRKKIVELAAILKAAEA